MNKAAKSYQRFVYGDIPVYVNPEKPDWFVPTQKGDEFLELFLRGKSIPELASKYARRYGGNPCLVLLLYPLNGSICLQYIPIPRKQTWDDEMVTAPFFGDYTPSLLPLDCRTL